MPSGRLRSPSTQGRVGPLRRRLRCAADSPCCISLSECTGSWRLSIAGRRTCKGPRGPHSFGNLMSKGRAGRPVARRAGRQAGRCAPRGAVEGLSRATTERSSRAAWVTTIWKLGGGPSRPRRSRRARRAGLQGGSRWRRPNDPLHGSCGRDRGRSARTTFVVRRSGRPARR